jgi:hypothetical protein
MAEMNPARLQALGVASNTSDTSGVSNSTALTRQPGLAERTRAAIQPTVSAVAEAYLDFRKTYYHEAAPTLDSVPQHSDEVLRSESGTIAEQTLRFVPKLIRELPLLRDMINHLQWEVDIHSLTEQERIELHNMTMVYLHGVQDGVQPWYVDWVLRVMQALQYIEHPDYYLAFPWQGLLYRSPQELAVFEQDVADGNINGIIQEMEGIGNGLVEALRDPLGIQPKLCFSGPHGERDRVIFTLKTSAALALAAYLAYDLARDLLRPEHHQPPVSVIQGFPEALAGHVLPER